MAAENIEMTNFIWSVADLLRGPYRPNQYKQVMLPLTVLRRLDCVLEPTKDAVLEAAKKAKGKGEGVRDALLTKAAGVSFYNTSKFTFAKLLGDPANIGPNLLDFIQGFSPRAREILSNFKFEEQISKLEEHGRLFLVVKRFSEIDLHPKTVSNMDMGYVFEELIRKFNEATNEEAGDHFTPREVIRLMVDLLFAPDGKVLTAKGIAKSLLDPACGTGGMLSTAEEYLREFNPDATLAVFGQDYNHESYAICGADLMIKEPEVDHIERIKLGNSFTADAFPNRKFDYLLANPPFGVEWKPEADFVKKEHEEEGFGGRFGAGLPRINDGSLLFLQHMTSKMKDPKEGGTRFAIVFNGSPLFTGAAESGESNIRKWIIEHDWLEAIVALPDQLFYNTGIFTYVWIVTNRKEKRRKGKVQLIDGTSYFEKMRKSLGNKRHQISPKQITELARLYDGFKEGEQVRIFENEDFGYRRVTVERPLQLSFQVNSERLERVKEAKTFASLASSKKRKDKEAAAKEIEAGKQEQAKIIAALEGLQEAGEVKSREDFSAMLKERFKAEGLKLSASLFKAILMALAERDTGADICTDSKGNIEADPELRDYENIPLKEDVAEYMAREVLPHVPDAWIDEKKTKIGYEINFNRYFYQYTPPRELSAIEADLAKIEDEIAAMLSEVTA